MKDVLYECRIVWIAGKQMRTGEALDDDDNDRLDQALKRITSVRDMFNGIS